MFVAAEAEEEAAVAAAEEIPQEVQQGRIPEGDICSEGAASRSDAVRQMQQLTERNGCCFT